jgi:hypothetical protein
MHIPVLVEPVVDNGYRATSGPPLGLSVEGATRAEAIDKLERLLRDRLSTAPLKKGNRLLFPSQGGRIRFS